MACIRAWSSRCCLICRPYQTQETNTGSNTTARSSPMVRLRIVFKCLLGLYHRSFVCSCFFQDLDHRIVAIVQGKVQSGLTVMVPCIDRRSCLEQISYHGVFAVPGSLHQGGITLLILQI